MAKAQSQIVQKQLKTNTLECMICCDIVRRHQSIWYCSSCYNIFHLKCSIEWCNKSIASRDEALQNAQYPSLGNPGPSSSSAGGNFQTQNNSHGGRRFNNNNNINNQNSRNQNASHSRNSRVEWPCPACRELIHARPGKYKCFCGKVTYPEINRHLTPHSCGQLCGKKRPNVECPHNCNALCHPGRCDPCPLTSKKSCFCGKRLREEKCASERSSCDEICGKSLACKNHNCDMICHDGSCKPCEEITIIQCNCGRQTISKNCMDLAKNDATQSKSSSKSFSCDTVCGKKLDCGNHNCEQKCHSGPDCKSCNLLNDNLKNCPCGATELKREVLAKRKSCSDPIPTCGNKCNKKLICGTEKNRHKCHKKCHTGSCPPCKLKTNLPCECRAVTRNVDCANMFQKIVEGDMVSFKQTGYKYSCESRCNKLKSCNRHKCTNKCCQYLKFPETHKCEQTCNKKLACGAHNCPEPCHPGQCGDCTNIGWQEVSCHCGSTVLYPPIPCGTGRPTCNRPCRRPHPCGHPVKHECHDDTEKCAPCTIFVEKSCFCGADSKDSVYCYQPGYSCGKLCKKTLPCGRHQCNRVCHVNECTSNNQKCQQPCNVIRYNCKHPCSLPCHGRTACPPSECKREVEVSCKCKNKLERMNCVKLMRDVDNSNKVAMMNINRSDQDSIMIDLTQRTNNKTNINDEDFYKRLECDATCEVLRRNKALAEALDIDKPDLKPVNVFGEDPLKLLKEAALQDFKFVSNTFNSLARFVNQARESDKRFMFMQYPPCDKLRREILHELAHHFHCTSETRGEEPFKQVIVRAYKNKSVVPDFTIEQLIPISDE